MSKKKQGPPQPSEGGGQGAHQDAAHGVNRNAAQKEHQPRQHEQKKGSQERKSGERADEDPEKKIQIDDNPDETKKKIPHME